MNTGELNLAGKVPFFDEQARQALDAAIAAKDPEIQRHWNEIAEGWFKLAECVAALARPAPD